MALPALNSLLALFRGDPAQAQPPVRFVPAPYLFVHAEPLPEGMLPAEVAGFAEVTIEGLAPMPLDQISWGYLTQEGALHIFLFAAARDRLDQANLTPDESFFHVLPSFYAATPADNKTAHWVMLWEAGHVVAVRYEANQSIPSRIEVEIVTEDTPEGAFAARERLLKRLGPTAREAQPGLLANPLAERAGGERLKFFFDYIESPEAAPKRVEGKPPSATGGVWPADMRDSIFSDEEQKRRRGSKIGTRVLQAAGGLAVLLFVLQMVWLGGRVYYQRQLELSRQQAPLVAEVQNNLVMLRKIAEFTEKQTRPFELIAMLNAHRPKGVIFATTKITNYTTLQIEGRAPDSATVVSFRDALTNAGLGDVKVSNILGSGRDTRFSLLVSMKDVPERERARPEKYTPPPPPPVAPPAAPDNSEDEEPANVVAANFNRRGGPNNSEQGGGGGGDGEEFNPGQRGGGGGRRGGRGQQQQQQQQQQEEAAEEEPEQPQQSNAPVVIIN